MLSRSAQGLYWMGRYLERAEHLCRLLRLETEALVDRSPREIYFGWSRIYGSINRLPPGGTLEIGDDLFTLVDSYTLADDLTFEHSNPDSVWSCFALGRELTYLGTSVGTATTASTPSPSKYLRTEAKVSYKS